MVNYLRNQISSANMPTKRTALPLYRQVLSDAWTLTLTHRHLWVFGFFATFIGFGGVSEIMLGAYNRIAEALPSSVALQEAPWMIVPGLPTLRALINLSPSPLISIGFFTIVSLLLFVLFAWVISVAIGALLNGISQIERGGRPTFAQNLRAGSDTMPRVLVINLGAKLLIGLTLLITGANLLHMLIDKTAISALFFVGTYILFTLLAVVISLVSVYATNSTVVSNLPVVPAVFDAWQTAKKHWLISFEMIVILLLVNIGMGLGALLLAMIVSVPLIFLFLVAAVIQSSMLMAVIISITLLVLLAVLVVAASFLTTFQASAWTLLWIKLTGRQKHHPKIMRLAEWLQEKFNN